MVLLLKQGPAWNVDDDITANAHSGRYVRAVRWSALQQHHWTNPQKQYCRQRLGHGVIRQDET